jgi:mycothiol synthase
MSTPLRPPRDDDVDWVARLMSEFSPEPVDPETVRSDWTAPAVELEHDARIEADGYCHVEDLNEGRAWIDVHGRPSAMLLDWAEARGREVGTRLFSGAWSSAEALLAALEARGFEIVRHAHRMQIDLEQPLPPAEWPDGVVVRSFQAGDERTFYEMHQETFEDVWEPIRDTYEEWTHWFLQSPDFAPELWFLALAGDEPAGFAICHPRRSAPGLGWVQILGVRRAWRRRGLGRALLLHAFDEFSRRGFSRVGLGVDATSLTGANRLYEQVGMRVAARFDIYEKQVA